MLFSLGFSIHPASPSFHWRWLKRCWTHQPARRGHSPCTCSFLRIKTGHKGTLCEKEKSPFSPHLLFPPSLECSYTIGYAIWYPVKLLHPREFSPDLGTQHPPASCPTIQNQHSPGGELFPASRNPSQDIERESSPMKLASFNNFCIRRQWRIFQIEVDMSQRKKQTNWKTS